MSALMGPRKSAIFKTWFEHMLPNQSISGINSVLKRVWILWRTSTGNPSAEDVQQMETGLWVWDWQRFIWSQGKVTYWSIGSSVALPPSTGAAAAPDFTGVACLTGELCSDFTGVACLTGELCSDFTLAGDGSASFFTATGSGSGVGSGSLAGSGSGVGSLAGSGSPGENDG